jgi:hypothetical protein
MNSDRKKLIEKLKTVKDPRERDRLMWALAGFEKDHKEDMPIVEVPGKTASSPPQETKPELPKLPAGLRQLFAYFVPGLFLLFGITNLLEALVHILPSGKIENAIPQLIIGSIFMLVGIAGIIKARKKSSGKEQDTQTDEDPA